MHFFFNMEPQRIPNRQSNFEKKEQRWMLHTSDFKTHYKTTVIKKHTAIIKKNIHKWNYIESSKIGPQLSVTSVIYTRLPRIHNGQRISSLTNGVGNTEYPQAK